MGYRGEDRASERAAWGAQSPRQSATRHTDGYGHDGYGQDDGYGYDDYDSGGYRPNGYGDAGGYGPEDYGQGGYPAGDYGPANGYPAGVQPAGSYGPASHPAEGYYAAPQDSGSYGGYLPDGSGGYPAAGSGGYPVQASGGYPTQGADSPYPPGGSGGYPIQGGGGYPAPGGGGYPAPGGGGYPAPGGAGYPASGSGGYPTQGSGGYPVQGSGGYPTQGGGYPARGSGGYPTQGGGYPPRGSGGYPVLGGGSGAYPAPGPESYNDGNDWYARSGPIPASGFADTSAQLALREPMGETLARDPVRGYPPEPARPGPGLASTRQQARYDENAYVSYPGYDGVDDAQGNDPQRGYDYDDYANATRLDQVAVDYNAPRPPASPGGYRQPLPGDDFDGGFRDDGQPGDVLSGPGRGDPKGPGKQKDGQPRRPWRRIAALSAAAVIVIGAAGYGGYQLLGKSKANSAASAQVSAPLPSASVATAMQKCVQQLGEFCHISTRADDPAPLTLAELFQPAVFSTADKINFSLAGTRLDTDCSKAVYGTALIAQLKTGQCTQALRASYTSDDQTIMGTIGVFNLSSTNQAHYAAKIINASNFLMPLNSAHGAIAKLGQGIGVIEPQYKGHYLILTWAQFANVKSPTAAQQQQLQTFEDALVASTANVYLSQIMVNGDGPASGATGAASPSASASASRKASPTATG